MGFSERCRQAKILKIANFKALRDVAREEIERCRVQRKVCGGVAESRVFVHFLQCLGVSSLLHAETLHSSEVKHTPATELHACSKPA